MNNRPPLPKVITANKALNPKHKYIIMTKSRQGRFINFSFNHNHWDYAIFNALFVVETWLAKVDDEVVSSLVIPSEQATQAVFADILNSGVDYEDLCQQTASQTSTEPMTPINIQFTGDCRQVTDIRQLEDYNSEYRLRHDSVSWDDMVITVVSEQGYHFIFSCDGFSQTNLTSIWGQTHGLRKENKLPPESKDPIVRIIISHKSNRKHYDTIKRLLENKPLPFNYNLFLENRA